MTEIDAVPKVNVGINEMLWVLPFTLDSDLIKEIVAIHYTSSAIQRKSVSLRIVGSSLISRKPENKIISISR